MKKKAIGLLSGGLDSTLAVRLMIENGIEVLAVNFKSPFCNCTSKKSACSNEAVRVANEFGIKIKSGFMGEDFLKVVAKPRYGYGKNMNPCLDCRILMFTKAKEMMSETGASFIFTGEVLGQRPMSQRRDSMRVVERDSGLDGLILRPLSAKLFEPTIPEKEGIVDREKLLAFTGRSRKPQISMAEEYGITDYPCPAGGCLLTDTLFAKKVKDLMKEKGELTIKDVNFLKVGRHFRLNTNDKVIVGRDEHENKKITALAGPEDLLFEAPDYGSPIVWANSDTNQDNILLIAGITARYSSAPNDLKIPVTFYKKSSEEQKTVSVQAVDEKALEELKI